MLKALKSVEVLNDPKRSVAIDFYRGIAVIAVVLFHFDSFLPYGYLGVDLFFVISGFLVGGILVEKYNRGSINYKQFLLQRSLKIWPSFYFFLLVGNIIAYFLYKESNPSSYIPLNELKRYLLFYRNYTGIPEHWNFDHVWSLCIEEHFYLFFPIILSLALLLVKPSNCILYIVCFLMIGTGLLSKLLMLNFTNGKDTYAATHNRIDALAYGVLLYLIIYHWKKLNQKKWIGLLGLALLTAAILIDFWSKDIFFNKVIFHSIIPLFFSMIILGTFHFSFKNTYFIRFISYYSYNIYLWHPLLIFFIYNKIGINFEGLIVYLASSFLIAFMATITVEEYFLKHRKNIIDKILGNNKIQSHKSRLLKWLME